MKFTVTNVYNKFPPYTYIKKWTISFQTERCEDRNFNSVLHLNNNEFTTPYWEKSKQLAEQASAAVATTVLEIMDGRLDDSSEQLEKCRVQWMGLNFDKSLMNLDDGNKDDSIKGENSDISMEVKRKCDGNIDENTKRLCTYQEAS